MNDVLAVNIGDDLQSAVRQVQHHLTTATNSAVAVIFFYRGEGSFRP